MYSLYVRTSGCRRDGAVLGRDRRDDGEALGAEAASGRAAAPMW